MCDLQHAENFGDCLDEMVGIDHEQCSDECTAMAHQLQEDAGCWSVP